MRESSQSFNVGTLCGRAWTFSAGLTGPRNLGIILGRFFASECAMLQKLHNLKKSQKNVKVCHFGTGTVPRGVAHGGAPEVARA